MKVRDNMTDDIYDRLADALDRLPNGFPRTPSNTERQILKKIFAPEEAALAFQLCGEPEPIDVLAARFGLPVGEAMSRLISMARRGLVWYEKRSDQRCFRLAPFVVGIYESQVENMDHELAHLVEQYMADGGAVGMMQPQPAIHRVVPAQTAVQPEWILPYDDVRAILLASKTFHVRDCICRVQQTHLGHPCKLPVRICLSFSSVEGAPTPDDITQAETLALLEKAEEVGLVHTVSNMMQGIGYVCNCCGCCCAMLRGITQYGIEHSVARAGYYAVIDPDDCLGCGTCIERCQVHAIAEQDGISVVDREQCIGCGLCVTGCPNDVAELRRRPEAEIVHPVVDFAAWEHERLVNRGLIERG
jgi:H+/Na+-translocating ferredoxin:NAD+ oxidoreductase subunit B